jgi:RNA polymerase sigma-70 factor (ECF subfamily)
MKTEKIWSAFSDTLKKFILSKVKDEVITDDILQEVFIKIHLNKSKIQKKDRIKSWLFTIAKNTTSDYFRKKDFIVPYAPNYKFHDVNSKDHHDARDCIVPLILNLPKKHKEVLLLTEIKGLKQQEAADQLGISLASAKSRVLRGRKLLKKGFMDCCNYTQDKSGFLKGEHKSIAECKVCS